jgi:hypothetical protein
MATAFEATKGQLDAATSAIAVDVDLANAQPLGHAHLARAAFRPDAGDEAVVRAVGDAHGVGLVVEGDHGQDRTENLVASQLMVQRHRSEQRGPDEEAALAGPFIDLAFGQHRNAVTPGALEETRHAVALHLADNWTAV